MVIGEKVHDPEVPRNFYRGAAHSAHQQRRHAAVLGMIQDLRGSFLDVGCGYGELTWAVSKCLGPAQGVDIDPARVAFAREQYAPIQFTACRKDGLDFAEHSFANAMSIMVLPFVDDVDAHMSELRRVLKPDGHLLLATRTSPWLGRLYRRVTGTPIPSPLHHHSVDETRKLLQKHGFEPLRWGAIYDPPFSSPRNLGDLINSTVEWVGELTGAIELARYPIVLARRSGS